MAAEPINRPTTSLTTRLIAFDFSYHAPTVASWIRSDFEAFMIAPRSVPPITADVIRGWGGPGHMQTGLIASDSTTLLGYGELNVMESRPGEYWLGHLIVDPARRGEGVGTRLAHLLLRYAFERLGACRVSLVVFHENYAAISAYRAAGLYADGVETHEFPHRTGLVRLLRMAAVSCE